MKTQQSPILAYGVPTKPLKPLPLFRPVAVVFGVCGLIYNLWNIHDIIWSLEYTRGVYDRLIAYNRSFGREISPDIIAKLEYPWWNWLSHGMMVIASCFGMLLALHLLIALYVWRKDTAKTTRYLRDYARFKLAGAVLTTVCYYWAQTTASLFWTYASRHTPIGTSEMMVINTAMLTAGSVFSWWWVARGYRPAMQKLNELNKTSQNSAASPTFTQAEGVLSETKNKPATPPAS